MLKVLLIGGGLIATHYYKGLSKSKTLSVIALADINPNCLAAKVFDVPFFTDYTSALYLKPDLALITVPSPAKTDIACDLMKRGISVLVEKPVATSLTDIDKLIDCAKEHNVNFECMFHWKNADEVIFLRDNLASFGRLYGVETTICDDYANTPDGSVKPERRGLLGAWYDSGINVLSYYDEIFDLSEIKELSSQNETDKISGEEIYINKKFSLNGIPIEITVDWRTPNRQKTSIFHCEKGTVFVDHTAQTVYVNGDIVKIFPTDDRLESHYVNLFESFAFNKTDIQKMRFLHKLLLNRETDK